ncbi:hypothetical protein PCYB_104140 [Plasmodium cynomolgi strain B]|uniref:Uncharacterized protein n=1 Tax=Plasmodium cynomolgi (strain B) TaxID=1120755 RepID=K6UUH3_PLACD|nr:hypothetical protein PCYB_104140 [Plasmodium cynomolgi strain B]GAB67064.1 hypothetical protein PCYB_104140 [Plasmodium cynomolgi strain B]
MNDELYDSSKLWNHKSETNGEVTYPTSTAQKNSVTDTNSTSTTRCNGLSKLGKNNRVYYKIYHVIFNLRWAFKGSSCICKSRFLELLFIIIYLIHFQKQPHSNVESYEMDKILSGKGYHQEEVHWQSVIMLEKPSRICRRILFKNRLKKHKDNSLKNSRILAEKRSLKNVKTSNKIDFSNLNNNYEPYTIPKDDETRVIYESGDSKSLSYYTYLSINKNEENKNRDF